jgi:hypothetical protein
MHEVMRLMHLKENNKNVVEPGYFAAIEGGWAL